MPSLSEFTPNLIISTGRTNAMFTLRETYRNSMGDVTSYYLINLSINPDEAFTKALDWSKNSGMPLLTVRSELDEQLREIERNLEGMTKAERKEAERLEKETARNIEFFAKIAEMLAKGVYPFGYHYNVKLIELPRSYITWIINTEFDADTPMSIVKIAVTAQCSHLALPVPSKTLTIGTVGKRDVFDVQVIRTGGYANDYGWVNVITMISNSGACLVSKGAFIAELGDKIKIKGTVKQFSEYKKQMQTQIQRVAVVSK